MSWFHRVTAIDASISYNVWCNTDEGDLDSKFHNSQKQLLKDWKENDNQFVSNYGFYLFFYFFLLIILFVVRYLKKLIDNIKDKEGSWFQFMKNIINTRFIPIFGLEFDKFDCGIENKELIEEEEAEVEEYIKEGSKIVKLSPDVNGIQEVMLVDFIEQSSAYLFGTKNLNSFLQSCFQK
jgi:hypothetical protein